MLKVISQDPDRFAASEEDIGNFEEILVDVEITLLQSSTFQVGKVIISLRCSYCIFFFGCWSQGDLFLFVSTTPQFKKAWLGFFFFFFFLMCLYVC